MELKIDNELKEIIPPLADDEIKQLENNLLNEGWRDNERIITWNNTIVDGHNRYSVCTKHNIPFKVQEKEFADKNDVIIWMIDNQLGRRNIPDYARVELNLRKEDILKPIAEERMKLGKKIEYPPKISWEGSEKVKKEIEEIKKQQYHPDSELWHIQRVKEQFQKEQANKYNQKNNIIYLATAENKIKIGHSLFPEERIKQLKTGNPDIVLIETYKGSVDLEIKAHQKFKEYKLAGEWFKGEILDDVKKYLERESKRENETSHIISKLSKVSTDTVHKVKFIRDNADEETKAKLRSGNKELSINKVYTDLKKKKEREDIVEAFKDTPVLEKKDKKYSIIYADPPWHFWGGGWKNQTQHYKTMSMNEIKELPVSDLADENCILFLWVTFPILKEAFEVIESWGFKYSTCGFNWVKKSKKGDKWHFGLGYWTRANSELCLIATKGKPVRQSASVSQIIDTPVEEHSKKPDIVRDKIVELVGDLPRIELFARERFEGWDSWGNEVK